MQIDNIITDISKIYNLKEKKKLEIGEPNFSNKDIKIIKEVILKNEISSIGSSLISFEKKIKKFIKNNNVVLLNSGTSALNLTFKLINLSEKDEVLLPSLNYIASLNAIRYFGAEPHFVEINETLSIDCLKLKKYLQKNTLIKNNYCYNKKNNKKIAALCVFHPFGNCANIEKLKKICAKFKIFLIEDAAEAFGTFYQNKHLGTIGDFGILSFNGNKIITTGAGGAIIFKNKKYLKKIMEYKNQGKLINKKKLSYLGFGYNFMMPNINACLGVVQMNRINQFLKTKKKNYLTYKKFFQKKKYGKLYKHNENSNCWANVLLLSNEYSFLKDSLIKKLNKNFIMARSAWVLLHHINRFKNHSKMDLQISENFFKRMIVLPSSTNLKLYEK